MLVITQYGFLQLVGVLSVEAYCAARATDTLLQAVKEFFDSVREIDYADPILLGQLDTLLAYGIIDQAKHDLMANEVTAYQWLIANGFWKSVIQAPDSAVIPVQRKYDIGHVSGDVMAWIATSRIPANAAYIIDGEVVTVDGELPSPAEEIR